MFGFFRRRQKRRPSHAALTAVGVRTESDAEYRQLRIEQFTAHADPARATVIAAALDRWHILESSGGWIAYPLWDDEPLLTREAYPSREAATDAVRAAGGALYDDTDRAWSPA